MDIGQCTKKYCQTSKWLLSRNKKISRNEIEGSINEVAILSMINHHNWAVASRGSPLLVYKFISNETHSHHLHFDDPQLLSWKYRLNIVVAIPCIFAFTYTNKDNQQCINGAWERERECIPLPPSSHTTTSSFYLSRLHISY